MILTTAPSTELMRFYSTLSWTLSTSSPRALRSASTTAFAQDGRVFRIPGVSHWVNIDAPHRVNGALLQWLDGQEPH